jgi:2-oxoglutarate ferredoxin oxidoreductase subunit alpha
MMQARWGSHGHYEIIALVPSSVQECFDLTIRAFNLAERYRTPVLIMADAEVGHLTERLVIPPAEEIEVWSRKRPSTPPGETRHYAADDDLVPPMAVAGEGYKVFVESLTHDERGYPSMTPAAQRALVGRLTDKIRLNRDRIGDIEERGVDGAEVVIVAYGISARVARQAMEMAERRGIRTGLLRLKTVWPFPDERVRELSRGIRGFVVPEINLGQIVREVERCAVDQCGVTLVPNPGGEIHDPEAIVEAIVRTNEWAAPCRAAPAMA